MKPLVYSLILTLCLSCWLLAFTHPLWIAGAFALSWGGVGVVDCVVRVKKTWSRRCERQRREAWGN